MDLPPRLPDGGLIGLIAPAGPATLDVGAATAWVEERGYGLRIYPTVYMKRGYLAGSDQARRQDLHDAFADPEIDAIFCVRGGYGTPRLLDTLDFDLLRQHPKPFVGYSDITALHVAIARYAGFLTFHGPLFKSDLLEGKQAPTEGALWQLLRGERGEGDCLEHPAAHPLTTVCHGVAEGRLMGGNLAILCATLGTPWALNAEDIILFIEDVNEPLYRIDRLLTQLRLAGKLAQVRGVVVGDFAGISVEHSLPLLRETFAPLGIPVLAGWRSGHCDPNLTLPLGASVSLDASTQQLRLLQAVVR
ncbi:LD-carboxypeptidase [Pseudomonas sp. HR96]|uniref:S66 peptidase family protein n=1 Tax=Pseudomonas sp. HR96 TaxID=1027966 RepID=UPI002A74D355|nr:LD-carboxypeptidase [Pseudomonas sp. HR96]WPO99437.1 LD-carboxypeptidase [Pseudomonas sp. HR96]